MTNLKTYGNSTQISLEYGEVNLVLKRTNNKFDSKSMKDLKTFNDIIKVLQWNDKNGNWDEILDDNQFSLKDAIIDLKNCLEYHVAEYSHKDDYEIKEFYQSQLNRLN